MHCGILSDMTYFEFNVSLNVFPFFRVMSSSICGTDRWNNNGRRKLFKSFANSLTLLEYRSVQPMHMLKAWSQPLDFLAFGSSRLSEQRKDSKKLH